MVFHFLFASKFNVHELSPHNYKQVDENHRCENSVVNISHQGPSLGVWHEVTVDYHKVCVDQNESLVCKLNVVLN